jgi:hypothetical protein
MLGFFHGRSFFPTATATRPLCPPDWWVINYRHGRMLGCSLKPLGLAHVLWDPVTGELHRLPLLA